MRSSPILSTGMLGLAICWQMGCSNSPGPSPITTDPPPIAHDEEDHGHGHEGHNHSHGHSHEQLGPHGGHLLELGDEKFHAEWTHDEESGKLTVFILDSAAKELVPITAEKLVLEKSVGARTDKYDLVAIDRQGETPKTAQFEIVDKALVAAVQMVGDGVKASLTVDVNGQPFTTAFAKHEAHHGHKH